MSERIRIMGDDYKAGYRDGWNAACAVAGGRQVVSLASLLGVVILVAVGAGLGWLLWWVRA